MAPKVIGQTDDMFTMVGDDGDVFSIAKNNLPTDLIGDIIGLGGITNDQINVQDGMQLYPPNQYVQPQPGVNYTPGPQPEIFNSASAQTSTEATVPGTPPPMSYDPWAARQASADRVADVRAKSADETYQTLLDRNKQYDAMLEQQQEQEALRQNFIDQKMKDVEKAKQEFDKAEIKDPWASKSTGQKILAAISIGLNQFQNNMQGGENNAMKIINNAIEQDIALQKERIAKKGVNLQNERNLLSDNLKIFGDQRVAENVTRQQLLDSAMRKADTISAKYKGPEIQAAKQGLRAQFDIEKQKFNADLSNSLSSTYKTQMEAKKIGNELDPNKLTKEDLKRYVPGLGLAQDVEDAKKIKDARVAAINFNKKIDELINLRKKTGAEMYDRKAVQRMQQLAGELQLIYKGPEFAQLGVIAGPDKDYLDKVIPDDPSEFRMGNLFGGDDLVLNQIEQAKEFVNGKYRSELEGRGFMANQDQIFKDQLQKGPQVQPQINERDAATLEWAKNNPLAPGAAEVLKAAGENPYVPNLGGR